MGEEDEDSLFGMMDIPPPKKAPLLEATNKLACSHRGYSLSNPQKVSKTKIWISSKHLNRAKFDH